MAEPIDLDEKRKSRLSLVSRSAALKSGDDGGTFDGMEERVRRLEQRADKAADDIAEVRVSLATLIERVSHLPSKGYIDARLIGMLAAIAALTLFADKIKALIS